MNPTPTPHPDDEPDRDQLLADRIGEAATTIARTYDPDALAVKAVMVVEWTDLDTGESWIASLAWPDTTSTWDALGLIAYADQTARNAIERDD